MPRSGVTVLAHSKKFLATLGLLGVLSQIISVLPAQASTLSWPGDDLFVVGDAQWQFDEYGLAYGWDVTDNWVSDGYVYYPNEFRFAPDLSPGDSDDYYFLCGDAQTFRTEVTITQKEDGAVEILCPIVPVPGYLSLTAQLNFYIFPESSTGYLVRQHLVITNDSPTAVFIPDLELFNYPNIVAGYSAGPYTGAPDAWFEDSMGSSFALADGATWYSQGMLDGSSVFLTNAWALTGNGISSMYVPVPQFDDPYAGASQRMRTTTPNAFAANGETHLLTFTNMVLPADVSASSALSAQAQAQLQTQEFTTFSGRLIEGLPSCTAFAGWGITPGSCGLNSGVTPTPQPCIAELAQTGMNFFLTLTGALAMSGMGVWLFYRRRKTENATNQVPLAQ